MSFLFYTLFVVFIVVIDQITKYLTVLYIPAIGAQTFIPGIRQQSESFPFVTNYDPTVYDTINKLDGVQKCALVFSDGSGYTWDGHISASVNEGAVDSVVEMTISITPTTVPVWQTKVSAT